MTGTSVKHASCGCIFIGLLLVLATLQAHAAWPPPIPAETVLTLRNTTSFTRTNELVRSGVPVPRARNLLNINGLAVIDESGTPVPASFRVLARWNAARNDSSAPIQWLLVRFQATLAPAQARSFRLRMDGSVANPAPTLPLQLNVNGNLVDINTGVARFSLGGSAAQAFDRIEGPGGQLLVNGAGVSAQVDGLDAGFSSTRRVVVEHSDALSAVVIVEGVLAHPTVGGGAVSGGRRMEFAAGSPAVNVREWIDWEGSRCGVDALTCGDTLNALALQRWRLSMTPALSGTRQIALQGALNQPLQSTTATAGSSASLRQRRRDNRQAAQRFELQLPGQSLQTGTRADAGIAMLSASNGRIGVALRGMPDFEPQALRLLADGSLSVDFADDGVWLGNRQGTFAEYRLAALGPAVSDAVAVAQLWPALNAPLIALPAAQWIASTQATDEFPVGTLPPALAAYDTLLQDLMSRTVSLRRDRGLEGLMTFGLYPRNWGNPVLSDEIDCGNDPTPENDWDDPYWCAFWTDYHNTSAAAVVAAWRFADAAPLYALSQPAAMRQLHTQLIRCAPDDDFFYCGQIPTGYRGYRTDFNSSHQYVENLIQTYWMSGDLTIVERLRRGAASYRGYLCPSRGSTPPGPVCAPGQPIGDDFAGVNDRVASQFYQMFRFVALAGDDASYLDDWRSNTARALTQNFALVNANGRELGFTETSGGGSQTIISGPGSYYTTQLWMASIYDFNVLYRLQLDTFDAALGLPAITPSRARHAWGRSLLAASSVGPGNGTAAGIWPNTLFFTFSGNRIGGTLSDLQPGWAPGPMPDDCLDDCLYDVGKATLTATLARSAEDLNDPQLAAAALDLTLFSLNAIAAQPLPMGKAPGEFFGRLTSAVARLARPVAPSGQVFADGFEAGE